jgi:WD40 repeat protein
MFVSCGAEDKTVIVWDYSKQCSALYQEFSEPLTDVSFHPSGDLLAVATSEKLYLLAATVDSLVNRAQWPLFNCLSIVFSNGGHFLVAASHIITFINPYTQEIIATLRGHSGLIHSLSWSPDDNRLVSSGSDGNVIEWNAVTQQQVWSVTLPKCDFESSVITDRGTVIACSRSEYVYHLFSGRHQTHSSEECIGFASALFATPACIILGDVLGGIVTVPFPFIVPPQFQAQFENIPQLEFSDAQDSSRGHVGVNIPFVGGGTFRSHCGKVTKLCSSLDGKVLFTAAVDASICVFNVLSAGQAYASSNVPIVRCDIPKQQFFLVSQSRFDELQHAIEKLKRDIQKQRVSYETSTIESLQTHQKTMIALTEQHEEKKGKLNQQIDNLRTAMDDSTVKAALIYQNMEAAHLNEAKALTNLYEQKLALERAKCDAIAKEVEDMKCAYEERIYLLRQQYKASLQDFTEKVDVEQGQLAQHLEATRTRIAESQDTQDRSLTELELEFDRDRMKINLEYHKKLVALEKTYKELVAKREKLKADTQRQEADITQLKADLERLKEKRTELDKEIKAQQHTLECRTSELNDRDETLLRQAERLDRLQISNSELEKNKTIMSYRLQEMSDELQPSLDEIARLSAELDGNSDEIRTIKRFAKANHRTMQDKAHQITVLRDKLEAQKATLLKKRRVIQMFNVDLTEGVAREDPGAKAAVLKELHDKYVAAPDLEDTLKDANETIDEHTRQRKYLQQSVMLLQRQVHQQQEITAKHFTTKSAENSILLSDLNRLQKENRTLKKRLDNAKSDVEMLESNLRRVRQAQLRQARSAQSALGQHAMVDWVKQKSQTGASQSVSVIDGRGKYLHSGAKT